MLGVVLKLGVAVADDDTAEATGVLVDVDGGCVVLPEDDVGTLVVLVDVDVDVDVVDVVDVVAADAL